VFLCRAEWRWRESKQQEVQSGASNGQQTAPPVLKHARERDANKHDDAEKYKINARVDCGAEKLKLWIQPESDENNLCNEANCDADFECD
jgi:hypothetical protein